jgi:hypothetical protein
MNELAVGLYQALSGTAITALLSGGTTSGSASIYHLQAADGANLDYVVFNVQGGGDRNMTPTRLRDMVVYVRAYSATSARQAGLIDTQIDAAIHGKSISVSGWSNLFTARTQDIESVETTPSNEKIWCAGGLYRVAIGV